MDTMHDTGHHAGPRTVTPSEAASEATSEAPEVVTDETGELEDFDRADEPPSGYVSLGHDSDCETCGHTYNSVSWFLDGGLIHVHTSIGCYGGEEIMVEDLEEAVAFMLALKSKKRFPDAAADLAAEVERMREEVAAARLTSTTA